MEFVNAFTGFPTYTMTRQGGDGIATRNCRNRESDR